MGKDGINRIKAISTSRNANTKRVSATRYGRQVLSWPNGETWSTKSSHRSRTKMHMIVCKFLRRITDPGRVSLRSICFLERGQTREIKPYKAITGGHKFFLAANFHVA